MVIQAISWAIITVVSVFCLTIAITWFTFLHIFYEFIQPLNKNLVFSDWSTLMCYLNCITTARPGNRSIVIIREIINFEEGTLHESLKAMEQLRCFFLLC